MKSIITIVLSLVISIGAISQTYITQVKPYDSKLWGYMNQKGEMVVEAVYKKCFKFSENGLAPIYDAKKYHFINTKGEKLSTDIDGYLLIKGFAGLGGLQGFSDGLVAVQKSKSWGYLDSEGGVAIMLKYEKVSSFNNGFAIVEGGEEFFVINKKGEETKIEIEGLVKVKGFSEGLAPFADDKKNNGFINTKGQIAIPGQFVSVGFFAGGLAWVKTIENKIGFINKDGEWIIEPQFDVAKDFDPVSGLARVKIEGAWAYTNKNGEILRVEDTETWGDFYDGLAKGKKGGKTGYYNAKGEWIIVPELEGGRDFKNGFAAAKRDGKWGFIDKSGKWVIKPIYAAVKDFELVD